MTQRSITKNYVSFGMVIGAGIGLCVGVVLGSIGIGLAIGAGVGLVIGASMNKQKQREAENEQPDVSDNV